MSHSTNYARHRKPIHGFTLVELLVAISIIALLLSIIMPSLQKARERAKRIVCKSNLRQFGLWVTIYATDNNGNVSPEWAGPGEIPCYAGAAGYFFAQGLITEPKTYLCPSKPDAGRMDMSTIDSLDGWGYGRNGRSCRVSYEYYYAKPLKLTECRGSEAALMWDLWGGFSAKYMNDDVLASWIKVRKSHKEDGGNVLYVDSHVDFLKRSKWWVYSVVPDPSWIVASDPRVLDIPVYLFSPVYGPKRSP